LLGTTGNFLNSWVKYHYSGRFCVMEIFI